ncbi:MAG: PAS and helix-turn-helix domain-containing protein [Chloroflexi bacterium]|nr:PAS and helix-turn-helix domain-containing protein [Chloroflexota bacterium]
MPDKDMGLNSLVSMDGVFAVDAEQRIMFWSKSAQRLLGYRSQDVMGKRCYELVGGRDSRNYRFCRRNCPVIANARRGRSTPNYDILCRLPSGEEKWLNISVLVPTQGQQCFQVLHVFRDVTQRRRIEEFARKASATLRTLINEQGNGSAEEQDTSPTPLPRLSRREMEVLRLLAAGMTTQQVAKTLGVQPVTARNHVTRLLTKLGVDNRLQAVVYASQRHLI